MEGATEVPRMNPMAMQPAPKSLRLHIGLFGRRNVGKSSLLNAITRQQVSIVSAFAGTTTDPVEKPMELLPVGPVLFIDTAGVDDVGALGELRVQRTHQVFDRTDVGILVFPPSSSWPWRPRWPAASAAAHPPRRRRPAPPALPRWKTAGRNTP